MSDEWLEKLELIALIALARANIPTDTQELLVGGNPMHSIAPGALRAAIVAVVEARYWMPPSPPAA